MCELFGMSSRLPTNVSFSLQEFAEHGGGSAIHKDGWGIAFYEGADALIVREPLPAFNSPAMAFVQHHKIQSQLVISHIRMATQGQRVLANTQPFNRELGGNKHVFAHNGDLLGYSWPTSDDQRRFDPIGDTDSEKAFCELLEELTCIWSPEQRPSIDEKRDIIQHFGDRMRAFGPANFLYADAKALFAFGDRRRQRPEGPYEPPGLYWLCRTCKESDGRQVPIKGLQVSGQAQSQRVVLFASVPLTNEHWQPLKEGELMVASDGVIIR